MASVQELRERLSEEQDRALALSDRAFDAIDTITNAANFWITTLSILIAILAVIGLSVIYLGARSAAVKIATRRINSYIESAEGNELVRSSVREEVRSQIEQKAFLVVQPGAPNGDNGFPKDPKVERSEK